MFSLNSMRGRFHNTNIGRVIAVVALVLFGVLAISGLGQNLMGKGAADDKAASNAVNPNVATVDGLGVTRDAYQKAVTQAKEYASMTGQPVTPISMYQIRMQAFTQALNHVEMAVLAKQAGITVSDADTTKARQDFANSLKSQLDLPATATTDEVDAALQKSNGHSIDDYINKDDEQTDILAQKYQDMINAKNTATPEAVLASFRKVHTRHILISNKTHPDAEAKLQAENIIKQIQGGANFAKLVTQYTDDKATIKSGGDDGFIGSDTPYVPEFLNAALLLKDGQTTPEPIYSPAYGYFVIQAISSTQKIPADFEKNKAKYTAQVTEKMQQDALQFAMSTESASAKVVINDPLIQAYHDMSAGKPTPTAITGIIADLNKALASADFQEKPEIYAVMGALYGESHNTAAEITALNNSIQAQPDVSIYMALGQAYQKNNDTANAIKSYQAASAHAYTDPQTHEQLAQVFKSMGKRELAQAETAWLVKYEASQKQANSSMGTSFPGKLNP